MDILYSSEHVIASTSLLIKLTDASRSNSRCVIDRELLFGGWYSADCLVCGYPVLLIIHASFGYCKHNMPRIFCCLFPFCLYLVIVMALLLQGLAIHRNCVSILSSRESFFMSGALISINTRHGSCSSYYTPSLLFDTLSGRVLFWLSKNFWKMYQALASVAPCILLAPVLFWLLDDLWLRRNRLYGNIGAEQFCYTRFRNLWCIKFADGIYSGQQANAGRLQCSHISYSTNGLYGRQSECVAGHSWVGSA